MSFSYKNCILKILTLINIVHIETFAPKKFYMYISLRSRVHPSFINFTSFKLQEISCFAHNSRTRPTGVSILWQMIYLIIHNIISMSSTKSKLRLISHAYWARPFWAIKSAICVDGKERYQTSFSLTIFGNLLR